MRILLFLFLSLASTLAFGQGQACTTTGITNCAGVQSCVSSNTGTVKACCLNVGASIGSCNLFNYARTQYATVCTNDGSNNCTTGNTGATINPQIGNSDFIEILGVTLGNGGLVNSCSTNIKYTNATVTPNGDGLLIDGSSCPTTVQNITIDGVIFDEIGIAGYEGRLSVRSGNTVTIKNSKFTGVDPGQGSDGIQLVDGVRNIDIGPNNEFEGILEGLCGATHCDTIQIFGSPCTNVDIHGNWFHNSSSLQLTESPCDVSHVRNNVLDDLVSNQIHCFTNLDYSHNSVYNFTVNINGASTSATFANNLWYNANWDPSGPGTGGTCTTNSPCTSCSENYGLYTSGCTGTNCLTGTPTFVGGTPSGISTFAGWELTGSVGVGNASDGFNRGSNYFGAGGSVPSAPSNFNFAIEELWFAALHEAIH